MFYLFAVTPLRLPNDDEIQRPQGIAKDREPKLTGWDKLRKIAQPHELVERP